MSTVIAEITMSLDGYIAGPNISDQQPLGENGEMLHEWIFGKATSDDKQWLEELMQSTGAIITGNHTYSTAIDDAWGGGSPFIAPAFVVCHSVPSKQIKGFTYVTTGIQETLKLAKNVAGEKNIWIMGGANIIQQYIKAGLIDELRIHIAPVLLGQGTKLFDKINTQPLELVKHSVTETSAVINTLFRFKK